MTRVFAASLVVDQDLEHPAAFVDDLEGGDGVAAAAVTLPDGDGEDLGRVGFRLPELGKDLVRMQAIRQSGLDRLERLQRRVVCDLALQGLVGVEIEGSSLGRRSCWP